MNIKLIISDFDGTLVDTQKANFYAYKEVLSGHGICLTEETYRNAFGMRVEEFMQRIGIHDPQTIKAIRAQKANLYPTYFEHIKANKPLFSFIKSMKKNNIPAVLASTAQRINIENLLAYIGEEDCFDLIIAGTDINKPKPDPECFLLGMNHFHCQPEETLIFEDSNVGIEAAKRSGASHIQIKKFI